MFFQFRRGLGCSDVVMELCNLNLATSSGGWLPLNFTAFLCILSKFLLFSFVYHIILLQIFNTI